MKPRRAGVDEELRHHIELMVEENLARGMSAEQARADALRRFGDLSKITEACVLEDQMKERRRARRDFGWGTLEDVKQGIRSLRRSPVYAIVIIATLAFSIGAVAIVFSAVSPYFLRALPFSDPDRLVHLFTVDAEEGWDKSRFSLPQFEDVRERSRAFEALATYYYGTANLSGDVAAEQVQIARMSANAFAVLGAQALHGRTFIAGEDGPAGQDVLVLSHGLWQRRYGGDPSVLGQTVRVNGVPHVVVGVMSPVFNFPFGGVKAWAPIRLDATREARDAGNVLVFGRLAAGSTPASARTELESIWRELAAGHPNADGRLSGVNVLAMRPALNFAYDILRAGFIALSGAVVFVLMVACANITGLGLARGASRRGEVAVRAALGATRWRQIRRLLVESTILASVGGGVGLLLAFVAMRALGPLFPEDLYAVGGFQLDAYSVGGTIAITLIAALLIGTLPALNTTAVRPGDVLRESGRSNAQWRRAGRLRAGLIVGELALALVLVVGAGLMARSLEGISRVPLGFESAPVLSVELTVPTTTYPDAPAYSAFYRRLADAVRALPGVAGAATTAHLPLNHETETVSFGVPGQSLDPENLTTTELFRISDQYFATMNVAVLDGRAIDDTDAAGSEAVAVVNRTLAEKHYGGDAIGRNLLIGDLDTLRAVRIVGVVENVRHSSVTSPPPPQVYLSLAQRAVRRRFLVAQAANGEASTIVAAVRTAVSDLDPDVPANLMRPMNAVVSESVGPVAAMSIVLGTFGGFALMLAAIGLYGLIAYSVSQRKAEFGVRLALGAAPTAIVRSVLGNGLRLAALGVAIGLAGAIAAGRLIASLLFAVRPGDPMTLAIAAAVLLATTAVAAFIPAARASRSDPLLALRSD